MAGQKVLVGPGEDFEVEYVDPTGFGGQRKSLLKVDGTAGTVDFPQGVPTAAGVAQTTASLDSNAAHITKVGGPAAAAGTQGKAADSGHRHQIDSNAIRVYNVVLGSNGAGPVTCTGVKVGDKVKGVLNLTDTTDDSAKFESTVTVNDQIQQTDGGNLSAKKFQFITLAQA